MEWVCPECDRQYEDPPEECVCGGQPVPAGTTESTDRLTRVAENAYRALFDPESAERDLLGAGPLVSLVFRLLLVVSMLLLVVILLAGALNSL